MSIMNIISDFEKEKCPCGKTHTAAVEKIIIENGAIGHLPKCINEYNGKKAFILADINTYNAAGEKVCRILDEGGIQYSKYIFGEVSLSADEKAVGCAIMHFDNNCDIIIGVGSGVINDIGKILSNTAKLPYIIVATAPSMDGYASGTSSMSLDALKVSLTSKCANVIIGDIDTMKNAPLNMLKAGLGDMMAKYVSICEWKFSNVITGEYYCERVAGLVRGAVKKCTDNAKALLKRDDAAVRAVFEGLVLGGIAMAFTGLSRPASGVEHYFSHIWDMRELEFGTKADLHGIQCAVGTMYAAKLYDKIKNIEPDKDKALKYVSNFDYDEWSNKLRDFLGKSAETMIELEKTEQKYSVEEHKKRLDVIVSNWDKIIGIINDEMLQPTEAEKLLKAMEMPLKAEEIGIDENIIPMTFEAAKDVRDKYVLPRLAWDLGIMDELKQNICKAN